MTDQHIYSNNVGDPLLILRSDDLGNGITLNQGYIELELPDPVVEHGVRVALDTYKLLELIDAAAPDAMRAYLRETSETQLDGIDAVAAEDVDEPAVIELSDDIDTRLHVIERLAKILRAGTDAVEVCTLADWVIDR